MGMGMGMGTGVGYGVGTGLASAAPTVTKEIIYEVWQGTPLLPSCHVCVGVSVCLV